MAQIEPTNPQSKLQFGAFRNKLILSLVINGLAPLLVYLLIRPLVMNDALALALAGVIPTVRTLTLWLWRRRVDWIGLVAVFAFAVGLAISFLSGGSPLALELRGSVVAGLIGAAFLVSVMIGKPLLTILLRAIGRIDTSMASNPALQKRLSLISLGIGVALLIKAAADLVIALTLPTATFLATSHAVNWVILGGAAVFLWRMRQHAAGREGKTR